MNKVLLWSGIILGVFIVLVGITFFGLTYLEPIDENVRLAVANTSESVSSTLLAQKRLEIDSLKAMINNLKSDLFFNQLMLDSLQEQNWFKDELVNGYKKTIDKLNNDLLTANKRTVNAKELAKTYETMKTDEMRPILELVDDETVITIYKYMNSRNRKNIIKALSEDRAASITQRLAGVSTG